jgi:hypothetical protein
MRGIKLVALACAVIVGTLPPAGPPAAQAAEVARSQHDSVQSGFLTVDPTGCVFTNVFLFGGVDTTKIPGGPAQSTQSLFVNASVFDACRSTSTFYGGSSQDVTFAFSGALNRVAVSGPIQLCDFSLGCSLFQIDITWTPDSEVNRTLSSNHFFCGPGCSSFTHGDSLHRLGIGTGSLASGAIELVAGPSTFASLDSFSFDRVSPD